MKTNDDKYNCSDYRKEMMLLGFKRRLENNNLPEKEREILINEIKKLEKEINID